MAKRTGKDWLNARTVATLRKPGYHADGGGLYLSVSANSGTSVSKSWILRYQVDGKRREMGLGSVSTLSLSDARAKRDVELAKAKSGADPINERKKVRIAARDQKKYPPLMRLQPNISSQGNLAGAI
jgi:hypothetical protein